MPSAVVILSERLLQDTGVAILPGDAFHLPNEYLTARLAYVNFDGALALSMSETIPISEKLPNNFADKHCGMLIQGVMKIADWIHSNTHGEDL